MCSCGVCRRIEQTKRGENPYFVRELDTGYVVIGDYQRFRGYSLFLCKECASELHFLEEKVPPQVPLGDVSGGGSGVSCLRTGQTEL